jgi:protein ImuB
VLLDLHGLGRLWASPESLGRALLDAAHRRALTAQAALAHSRTAALVLARARPGLTVVAPGREAEALAPLPLELLELDGERHALLRRWGLLTMGDLARLPVAELAARFGPEGPRLVRLARGEEAGLFTATPLPDVFETALELDWPVEGLEPLSFLLGRVLESLGQTLRARGRRAAALVVDLGLVDGSHHVRRLQPGAPSAEARTWRTLALLDLEASPPRDAIQSLLVRAEPTPARPVQFSLLDPAQPSPEKLAETLARLHGWTARGRGGVAALLDSHRPQAFAMGTFAPGPSRAAAPAGPSRAPRVALRVFRPPRPARVALRDGGPAFVSARGVRGAVLERAGPWRASGDWWDEAWSREEWDVALAAGAYRLLRDRLRDEWLVAGEID